MGGCEGYLQKENLVSAEALLTRCPASQRAAETWKDCMEIFENV